MRGLVGFLAILVIINVFCVQCTINKTALVVLDDLNMRNSHSLFFKIFEDKGWSVTFKEATDPSLELQKYGEYLYELLILFAPEADDFGGLLDLNAILNFIDDGNSLVLATGPEISDTYREIAAECGVEFGEDRSFVIDHFNFDVSDFDGDHTLLVVDDIIEVPVITGNVSAPVLYRGVDQILEEANDLLFPLLVGSSTCYSYSPESPVKEVPHSTGRQAVLVSALQARNNARALFSGSLEMFSDRFMTSPAQRHGHAHSHQHEGTSGHAHAVQSEGPAKKYDVAGNEEFVTNLLGWVMKERGRIASFGVKHTINGTDTSPRVYSVKQDMRYEIELKEWNGKEWKPYVASDVQLEFVMLDPYVRTYLETDGTGAFYKSFKIPDVYGIYTLRVNYHRVGYTSVVENTQVTIRPFKHNEFERFIIAAYPYYASAFSMMFGVFVFGFVFLYARETQKKKKKRKKKKR